MTVFHLFMVINSSLHWRCEVTFITRIFWKSKLFLPLLAALMFVIILLDLFMHNMFVCQYNMLQKDSLYWEWFFTFWANIFLFMGPMCVVVAALCRNECFITFPTINSWFFLLCVEKTACDIVWWSHLLYRACLVEDVKLHSLQNILWKGSFCFVPWCLLWFC